MFKGLLSSTPSEDLHEDLGISSMVFSAAMVKALKSYEVIRQFLLVSLFIPESGFTSSMKM